MRSPLPDLEHRIAQFGGEIFAAIGQEKPGAFERNYWLSRMMRWSTEDTALKVQLFRFVDTFPALRNSRTIRDHLAEYIGACDSPSASAKLLRRLVRLARFFPPSLTATIAGEGIRKMARQFIAGETPEEALSELRRIRGARLAFTVDLLGEYTLSEREAQRYLDRYLHTLGVLGSEVSRWEMGRPIIADHPGERSPINVSVKLSALYSQCSPLNFDRSVAVLSDRLREIVSAAQKIGARLYVDAEDSATNEIIYRTFAEVFCSGEERAFPYPGIVVQAYARNSEQRVGELLALAKQRGSPIAIRLVKGAYWDIETLQSELDGWPSPLFAHKESTDAQYERLSQLLIDAGPELCLPAFGSHNVRSLAHACCYAEQQGRTVSEFELQMLFGMAEPIARAFSSKGILTRLYVPIGGMVVGMGYLVRRLLENSSNESFLSHTFLRKGEQSALLRKPHFRG